MCRLFGYVTQSPRSVADLLGEDGLAAFTSLTSVHSDGWGMAWHAQDGTTRTSSSPRSADIDETYGLLVRESLSSAGLVHLRWASGGLDVRPENTHPFFAHDAAFAHNAHLPDRRPRGPVDSRDPIDAARRHRQRTLLPLRPPVRRGAR